MSKGCKTSKLRLRVRVFIRLLGPLVLARFKLTSAQNPSLLDVKQMLRRVMRLQPSVWVPFPPGIGWRRILPRHANAVRRWLHSVQRTFSQPFPTIKHGEVPQVPWNIGDYHNPYMQPPLMLSWIFSIQDYLSYGRLAIHNDPYWDPPLVKVGSYSQPPNCYTTHSFTPHSPINAFGQV